ncbi:hypothetical protein EVAR_89810_1 [Eumeta japonica]|uniref:Mariner Mos1 transposase n=1 Tax=Eumeta variegata TaxID=151549 RepID=A0A4C1YGB1_EUMVA|nr:hypothetical protein EVAR_89810_1 [Eumeta japonica]
MTTVALENYRTVNSDWYTTICLPEGIDELRKINRKRRIILHRDASSHMAKETNKFSKEKDVELTINPAYSPDLTSCDFLLFAKIKNHYTRSRIFITRRGCRRV